MSQSRFTPGDISAAFVACCADCGKVELLQAYSRDGAKHEAAARGMVPKQGGLICKECAKK